MKIKIQKNKNSESFIIEIPPVVQLSHVAPGENFPIFIHHDHQKIEKRQACFLAERSSLLIGHQVVKIKNDVFLKNHMSFDVIRDVVPIKKKSKSLGGEILSPMTGKIVSIFAQNDMAVKEGDVLLIIEAMKMENPILAQCDGVITKLLAEKGKTIAAGDPLFTITSHSEEKIHENQ
jgi:biotin carboxyl carrier protein